MSVDSLRLRTRNAVLRGTEVGLFSYCVVVGMLFLVFGCTEALPRGEPAHEVARYAAQANASASRAQSYAEQARVETERTKKLVEELRSLLARAKQAEERCAEVEKKIPKQKVRIVYRERKKPKEPKDSEEGDDGEGGEEKDKGPEYAPSDAPL